MNRPKLAHEVIQLHADLCSALGDPSRILLMYALAEKPRNVNELANEVNLSQPTTSRHLMLMRAHRLVKAVRQGQSVEYSLTDVRLITALDILRDVLRDSLSHHASLIIEME